MGLIQISKLHQGNHKALPLHDTMICRGNPLWLPLCEAFPSNDSSTETDNLENDLLMIIITFGILLDLFEMPNYL